MLSTLAHCKITHFGTNSGTPEATKTLLSGAVPSPPRTNSPERLYFAPFFVYWLLIRYKQTRRGILGAGIIYTRKWLFGYISQERVPKTSFSGTYPLVGKEQKYGKQQRQPKRIIQTNSPQSGEGLSRRYPQESQNRRVVLL